MEQTRAFAVSIMMFKEGKKSVPLQFESRYENHKEIQEGI